LCGAIFSNHAEKFGLLKEKAEKAIVSFRVASDSDSFNSIGKGLIQLIWQVFVRAATSSCGDKFYPSDYKRLRHSKGITMTTMIVAGTSEN
jgi:hypothetical protein